MLNESAISGKTGGVVGALPHDGPMTGGGVVGEAVAVLSVYP